MYIGIITAFSILPVLLMFWIALHEDQRYAPTPTFILGWALLLGYTLKGLYLAYSAATGAPHRLWYASNGIVDLGTAATMLGIVAFVAGYAVIPRTYPLKKKITLLPERNGIPPELLYHMILIGSIALMVTFFYQMGFVDQLLSLQFQAVKYYDLEEGGQSSLGFLTIGGDMLLIFFLYYFVFSKKFNFLHPLCLAIAFCSLCYFLASRRNAVIIIAIAFLMVSGIKKTKWSSAAPLIKYAIIGFAMIALSFASIIRAGGGQKDISQLELTAAIAKTTEQTLSGSYFMDPAKTAVIIDQTRDKDLYLYGRTYLDFILAPIPRAIWADKPPIRNSFFIAEEVLDLRINSGVPPSGLAELYLNFGWLGIILGMFIAGMISFTLYRNYRRAPDLRFARIPYAMSMLCVVLFFLVDYTMAVLFFIRYQIAIYVAARYWLSKEREKVKSQRIKAKRRNQVRQVQVPA